MPVAPSFDDLIEQFISEAQAQRATLRFDDGNITEAQAHGAGAMADVVLRYAAQAFKETFIDGAKGDALTALVDDHYNIQREPATRSSMVLQFQRTSGGGGGTIDAGTTIGTIQDADGNEVRFTTDTDVVVAAAANGPFSVNATCTTKGPSGNIAAGAATRIIDPLFDGTFSVTNPADAGGGNAEESDDQLKARARNFWTTLRRGTLAALELGARQVAAVRIAKAVEDPVTGLVTVVVADADGNSTAQMVSDVETELENWRAGGSIVTVIGGTRLSVDITGTLVVVDGVDAAVLAPLVNTAIAARMKKLRQGELLYLDAIKAAGIAVDPDAIEAIVLTTPADTVVPSAYQVIRPGTVTVS